MSYHKKHCARKVNKNWLKNYELCVIGFWIFYWLLFLATFLFPHNCSIRPEFVSDRNEESTDRIIVSFSTLKSQQPTFLSRFFVWLLLRKPESVSFSYQKHVTRVLRVMSANDKKISNSLVAAYQFRFHLCPVEST